MISMRSQIGLCNFSKLWEWDFKLSKCSQNCIDTINIYTRALIYFTTCPLRHPPSTDYGKLTLDYGSESVAETAMRPNA